MKTARPASVKDLPSVLADPVKGAMGELVGCGPVTLKRMMLVLDEER